MNLSEARHLSAQSIADHKAFEAKVCQAVRSAGGNVAEAARILGVSRRQMYRYVAESSAIARVVEDERINGDKDARWRRMRRK